ncbi:hypothetical protein E2562_003887 [Oryza meyeriana var. granulata]|uniref:Uncharacterized protein n=1 Tax=Oryza meyeriana var. granulata TaxID=110450 RepID=A0A6G1CYU4_9ORYZ|nr:hypothetical protein E2562_003887 [Oryza meyeriana var. granulata]
MLVRRRALLEPTKRASSRCFPPVAPPKFIADPRLRAHRVDDLFLVADLICPAPKGCLNLPVQIVSQPTHTSLPIPTRDTLLLTPTSDVLSCSPCVPDSLTLAASPSIPCPSAATGSPAVRSPSHRHSELAPLRPRSPKP